MKILMAAPYFGSGPGGVENYVGHLVGGLTAVGHDVVVVTSSQASAERRPRADGLRVRYLPYRWKLSNTPVGLGWSRRLRRIVAEEAPDVINAHLPVPGLADLVTRAAGSVPVVLTYHNDVVKDGLLSVVTTAYHVAVGRRTLAGATRVIVHSPTYARQSPRLRRHAHKVSSAPPGVDRTVFHTGVDTTGPHTTGLHTTGLHTTGLHPAPAGERIVLFVGNLARTHAHKGLAVLLEAVAVVRRDTVAQGTPIRLVVVGGGDGLAGYRQAASALNLEQAVSFVGVVSDGDLAAYYAAAAVLVLPSTNASEGFGMVLAEAQACGTPVIGSRIGGIPAAFVDGLSGLSAAPGSVPDLAARILEVIDVPETQARLARGAVQVAERFDWSRTVAATESVFRQVAVAPVVHVSTFFPPVLGGLERVVEESAGAAVHGGIPAEVLTSSVGAAAGPGLQWRDDGVRVMRLRAVSVGGLPIIPSLFLRVLAQRGRPILHAHYAQAGMVEVVMAAARLRRFPVVVHHHLDVRATGRFGLIFEWYRRHILPLTLRRADAVIVFSTAQASEMAGRGVRASRIRVIPNGVDVGPERPDPAGAGRPRRIVFVGRLVSQKNVATLLLALVGISHRFDTTIVGDGPLRNELEDAASAHGLAHVRFTGQLSPSEARAELRAADIFVLPSSSEGMPLALLEAMAEGAIAVGSDVSGIKDLIHDGENGLLFAAGDPAALRKVLVAIGAGTIDTRRLRAAGYQTALRFSRQAATDRLFEMYRQLSGTG
jgi:glycosyltransferase involved in cell wall biosynthesis